MKRIDSILDKWGEIVTLTENGVEKSARAIIQPMNRRYKTYFSGKRLPDGVLNNNHYYMIASPELVISEQGTAVITSNDRSFLIRSSGEFKVKNERLYVWAVLAARTEPLEDDYD